MILGASAHDRRLHPDHTKSIVFFFVAVVFLVTFVPKTPSPRVSRQWLSPNQRTIRLKPSFTHRLLKFTMRPRRRSIVFRYETTCE